MGVVTASFLIQLVLVRLLTQEDFGVYLVVYSLVALFTVLTNLGLPKTALRAAREHLTANTPAGLRAHLARTLRVTVCSAVIVGILFSVVVLILGEPVFSMNLAAYCGWGVALIALSSFRQLAAEVFRGFEDFRWSAFMGIKQGGIFQQGIVLAGLGLLAALGGVSLDAVFALLTVAVAIPVAAACPRLSSLYRSLPRGDVATAAAPIRSRTLLGLSLPIMVSDLSVIGLKHFDILVVGALMSPANLAIYGVAKRLTILVGTPLLIGNTAMSSFIPELFVAENRAKLERLVRSTATLAAIPSLCILAAMVLVPGFVLATIFGEEYREGATVLTLLSIGALFSSIAGSCATTLVMTGHQRLSMLNSLATGLLYVLLAPLVVTSYGITGAAVAMMVTVTLKNLSGLILVKVKVGIWSMVSFSPTFVRSLIGRTCRELVPVAVASRRRCQS